MNRAKSFEEMGREADKAGRDFAMAQNYLSEISVETAAARVTVTLDRAAWDNGSMRLAAELTLVVREQIGSLLNEAMDRLQQQGVEATAALRAAFDTGATAPIESRRVPREALVLDREGAGLPAEAPGAADPAITAHAPDTRSPQDGTREAPLPGQSQSLQASPVNPQGVAWNALQPQARELLDWVAANPGSRFARTPARDVLVAGGYLRANGNGQNATWDITPEGLAILPPPAVA